MITLNNVIKIYNRGKENEFEALRGISFKIDKGELVAVVGKSGAGKSTLLHILACIDSYEAGEYYIDDTLVKDLKETESAKLRNERIGLVMQDYALVEDFSAIENVLLPLDFAKSKKNNKRKLALEALEMMEMSEIADKPVNKLSGGQKQRVAIARAIVNQPDIILADEPTGALDSNTAGQIIDIFKKLHKEGHTVIIVTHDAQVASGCNRMIEITDGKLTD